ncbi:hypothetical protein SVIOM342S_10447 [Streptomyces violaceorubidus]
MVDAADLSRLDNGVIPLRKRRFEVWPYLLGVLKEANMVASARAGIASGSGSHTRTDVHLALDVFPPGSPTAHANPERIHQVVANLIDNAVKHSPPHGPATVRARRGSCPSPWNWRFSTRDPASRSRSGAGCSSGSTGVRCRGRTVRAATAAPVWASRSRAGRWICTAAGSGWPNPAGLPDSHHSSGPAVDVRLT